MLAAIFGASATTALGLLSLATSEVVAVKSFGVGAAMGVTMDFIVSVTPRGGFSGESQWRRS